MNKPEFKKKYLERIANLLQKLEDPKKLGDLDKQETVDACYFGVLSIVETLYGRNSPQVKELSEFRKAATKLPKNINLIIDKISVRLTDFARSLKGCLLNVQEEIENDLIEKLSEQISGEVISNFVVSARAELKNGNKDSAAVLACAALEETMKRKAESIEGKNMQGKGLAQIINYLKSKSVLQGTQVSIISSYTKLRNNAMHADWDKIEHSEVSSLIGFLESYLITNKQQT